MESTSPAPAPANNVPALIAGASVWFFPIAIGIMTYIVSPGYIIPFLNHPVARILIIIALVMHSTWCALFTFSLALRWHTALKIISGFIAACSMVVMLLIPMLGPATITILQALGPMYETGGSSPSGSSSGAGSSDSSQPASSGQSESGAADSSAGSHDSSQYKE